MRINRVLIAAAIASSMAAGARPDFEIREFEGALLVEDSRKPALGLSIQTDPATGNARIAITLYDPFGDPYIDLRDGADSISSVDWGAVECEVGGRAAGSYIGGSDNRTFERWSYGTASEDQAGVDMQRAWLDPESREALALETAQFTVHEQQFNRRAIDIAIRLVNVGAQAIVLPSGADFLVRSDSGRPQAGFRTPVNDYRTPPFRYSGPWLTVSAMSITSMKMTGVALFSNTGQANGQPVQFNAETDGTLHMAVSDGPVRLAPGEAAEWNVRVFCFAEDLSAKAIDDSYVGFFSGRTW